MGMLLLHAGVFPPSAPYNTIFIGAARKWLVSLHTGSVATVVFEEYVKMHQGVVGLHRPLFTLIELPDQMQRG